MKSARRRIRALPGFRFPFRTFRGPDRHGVRNGSQYLERGNIRPLDPIGAIVDEPRQRGWSAGSSRVSQGGRGPSGRPSRASANPSAAGQPVGRSRARTGRGSNLFESIHHDQTCCIAAAEVCGTRLYRISTLARTPPSDNSLRSLAMLRAIAAIFRNSRSSLQLSAGCDATAGIWRPRTHLRPAGRSVSLRSSARRCRADGGATRGSADGDQCTEWRFHTRAATGTAHLGGGGESGHLGVAEYVAPLRAGCMYVKGL